jgi:RNA polymerase sigma-70 factor (ECF subfamily)
MQSDRRFDFEQTVDKHQSMVFSIALRMTGDRGLAEEIAQDVFLELDRNLARLDDEAHLRNWLRRVSMSRATDALRRAKSRKMSAWVELEEKHSVEYAVGDSPLGRRVAELLTELPEQQRSVLILRYQEDLSAEEIAKLTGAPVATIKSQLQRGLKLLRSRAEGELKEFVRSAESFQAAELKIAGSTE